METAGWGMNASRDDADPGAANIRTARVDMNVAMDGGATGVLRRRGGTGNAGSIYGSVLDMGSVAVGIVGEEGEEC